MNVALSWPPQDVSEIKLNLYQEALGWLPLDFPQASETAQRQHLAAILQILAGVDSGDLPLPEVDFTRLLRDIRGSVSSSSLPLNDGSLIRTDPLNSAFIV